MGIVLIILQLFVLGVLVYFGAYLKGKATNLAKREDIRELTGIVESIKRLHADEMAKLSHERQLQIQKLDQLNDLRLAAVDERLKVHQEAYSLVFRMLGAVANREEAIATLKECECFWHSRSLYLPEVAREAFDKAMAALSAAESTFRPGSQVTPTENRKKITNALRVIEKCVNLPEFSSLAEVQLLNENG